MTSSKFLVLALAVGLAVSASPAHAQEEWTGLRSMGMGGAHRAVVTGNDAIFLNPAGMSLSKKYAIEGGYLYDFGRETHAPGVSVVDSVTSPVAGGVGYSYVSGKRLILTTDENGAPVQRKVDRSGNVVHLGFSTPFGRSAALGVSAKYMDLSYGGRSAINSVTVDAGFVMRPSPTIAFSVTGYGLTNTGSAEAPLSMGVGLAIGPPSTFQLAIDWVMDFTSAKYNELLAAPRNSETRHHIAVGFEWLIAQAFSIRGGYFHDRVTRPAPDNAVTFGLGYFSLKSKFGIQVAFQQRFLDTQERLIVAGIQFFM